MGKDKKYISKHNRILEIYHRLLSGEVIEKQKAAEEYGVNPRSIQRDIDSIRDFCSNLAVSYGEVMEIRYDRRAGGYRIVNKKISALSEGELFVTLKILLESRSLTKVEMKSIVSNLMEKCLPIEERKKMEDLISNELFHYVEPRHKKKLVSQIWDLGLAVYSHREVSLEYKKVNGEITKAAVKPVGIMESEFYFYLIAYIGDKHREYPGYPTIYRVDRIVNYQISDKIFYVPYKDRFEEGEFRKRISFMYGGKLHKIRLLYKGADINLVLDRIPTAQAERGEDGSFVVTAEIYGDMGLNFWLNGQRDVEILEGGYEEGAKTET